MNITFKGAVIISVLIHAIGIGAFYRSPVLQENLEEKGKKDMTVDYVVIKEQKTDMRETPKIEIPKKIEIKPPVKTPEEKKPDKPKETKETVDDIALKQARIKDTKDYINYYQLMREKVRRRLKRNYVYRSREGEVSLNFVLDSGGNILSCSADQSRSASDRVLLETAKKSLRESSPFPPFPKDIDLPKMSFNLTVVFKKR